MMSKMLVFITFINKIIYFFILYWLFLISYLLYKSLPIVSILIWIITFLIILIRYIFTTNYEIKGIMFEKKVKILLEKLKKINNFFLMSDILFYVDNSYTQIDNILITSRAIYIIENKNYSGWIVGNESEQKWTQSHAKSKREINNPIMQNNKHIAVIKKILNLFDFIPVYNVVVFSNNCILKNINVYNEKNYIVKDFDLINAIKSIEKELRDVIDEKAFKYLCDMLTKNNIVDKEKRENFYKEMRRKHITNY